MSYEKLTILGQNAAIPEVPDEAILECVQNPNMQSQYLIRLTCPEFTSLCPLTGQPDFAHIVIDYVPDQLIIESKSLKLFLASYRNHGAFHEGCSTEIGERLVSKLSPLWLRLGAYWYPRGGIPIDVFYQYGALPENIWVPDQNVQPYRSRG